MHQTARLRSQNDLLIRLLSEERSKTARLRTDLVQNFTQMIETFTDAQDSSLSKAVADVQGGNQLSLTAMETFSREMEECHAESSRRAGRFQDDLSKARETGTVQRGTGQEVR